MINNEIQNKLRTIFVRAFQRYTIHIEAIPDEPELIGIAIYNVESDQVKWVRERIYDINDELYPESEIGFIPLVRDKITTKEYYPEYVESWSETNCAVSSLDSFHDSTIPKLPTLQKDMKYSTTPIQTTQLTEESNASCNTELALAA